MPPSPIIPATVEVRLLWIFGGQGAVNVLHAIAPGGFVVNQTTTNTLGAAVKSAYTANLATQQPPSTSLVRVTMRDKRVAAAAEFLDTGAAVPGTGTADDPLPPQTAMCITLRTAQSGKSFRGRTYLGGFGELSNQTGGLIAGPASTAGIAFMNAVSAAMTSSGLTFAVSTRAAEASVLQRVTNHADGTTTTTVLSRTTAKSGNSTPVTLLQSRNAVWETQRRRNNGRGAQPTAFLEGHQIELPTQQPV